MEQDRAHPGQPYEIIYELVWSGPASRYSVMPPEVPAVDWGTISVGAAESEVSGDYNKTRVSLVIVADEKGDFEVPAISIPYIDTEEKVLGEEKTAEAHGPGQEAEQGQKLPSLSAESFVLSVTSDRTLLWVSLGIFGVGLALVLAVCFVAVSKRRVRVEESAGSGAVDLIPVQSALHTAKQRRIEGDSYGYYVELGRAAGLLTPDSDSELVVRLGSRAKEIGYRNIEPTQDDLDGDFKEVERALRRKTEELEP